MIGKVPRIRCRRRGAVLVLAMGIALMAGIAATGVLVYASQQTFSFDKQGDLIRAQVIAEAGAIRAYHLLQEDFSRRGDAAAFPATLFDEGRYEIDIRPVGTTRAIIRSTGYIDASRAEVILEVKKESNNGPLKPFESPYAHTLFALGDVRVSGSGKLDGSVYTADEFVMVGINFWNASIYAVDSSLIIGLGSVLSLVQSPSILGSGIGGILTALTQPVPLVSMPGLDLNQYFALAQANGQVFPGGTHPGNLGVIPGGVRWYDGPVVFEGDAAWTGAIISTGSVEFEGTKHTPVGDLPAVVSRDSSIRFNGKRSIVGLVWAGGNVQFSGSGRLDGSVVAGGDIQISGSYGTFSYRPSPPGGPVSGSALARGVYITAWQK